MYDIGIFQLKLRTPRHIALPPWLGRTVQAWYLDSLRQLHPELSAAVHDSSDIKPYTASGLLAHQHGQLRDFDPRGGTRQPNVYVRVTTLHPDVTNITQSLCEHWLSEGIKLHDHHFTVESVDVQTETFAGLVDQGSGGRLPRRLKLAFLSPTVFKKTGGIQVPLPTPAYVFGSLAQRWRRFSPVALCDDLDVFIEDHVNISSHRIQTQLVSFERANRGAYTGFRGDVEFYASSSTAPHFQQLHYLMAFAPFSGIGSHTTVGLGRVEVG